MNSTVQIDDFSVRDGVCSPSGSCDFESGQCTWVNILKEDGHDWVLANGHFQGPPTDHTTHTPEGTTLDKLNKMIINIPLEYKWEPAILISSSPPPFNGGGEPVHLIIFY